MNDHTMNRKALRGSAGLHMPPQAVPINRDVSPGALAGTPGVEADIFGALRKAIKWAAPRVLSAL
jgi:hypothetical protein